MDILSFRLRPYLVAARDRSLSRAKLLPKKRTGIMAEKRPPLPLMLTAQDLRQGNVVYWDGAGWTPEIERGLVARDEDAAAALEAMRDDRANAATVIDAFLFSYRDGAPAHFRERARLIGPSFRDDFGRNPAARVPA
jgi:hypothetical protein